jgi:hypothetical protein
MVSLLFTIFGFAFTLWFLFTCCDIFCRNHELYFIETAQGVIANEDDIIELTEANMV